MKSSFLTFLSVLMTVVIIFTFCLPIYSVNTLPIEELSALSDSENTEGTDEIPHYVIGAPSAEEDYSVHLDELKKLGAGELPLSELKKLNVEDVELHEAVPYAQAIKKGHVHRLKEQEKDLYTVVYQNKDGTKTAYSFNTAVKYIDDDGSVKDKKSDIYEYDSDEYAYAMTDNSAKIYFPEFVHGGVSVKVGETEAVMLPSTDTVSGEVTRNGNAENSLIYSSAFGNDTALTYTTGLSQLKEDIVLYSYTGHSVFKFELYLDGLFPEMEDGNWVLKDIDGFTVFEFSDIITKDSAGKISVGTLDIVQRMDNYEMYVTVDNAFLTDENTVYPVYVDPSLEIYVFEETMTSTNGDDIIEYYSLIDVGIYETSAKDEYTAYHYIGEEGSNGKIVYRMPDFYTAEYGSCMFLVDEQIGKVTLNIYVEAGAAANFYVYPVSALWDTEVFGENPAFLTNVTESTLSYYSGYSAAAIPIAAQAGIYEIDITEIARLWAQYNVGKNTNAYADPVNGFILLSDTPRLVRSSRYSISTDDAYVVVDYSYTFGEYYICGSYTYKFLENNGTSAVVDTFDNSDAQKWYFEYLGDNEYYIRSVSSPDMYLYASGTSVLLGTLPSAPTARYIWNVVVAQIGGVEIINTLNDYALSVTNTAAVLSSVPDSGTDAYKNVVCAIASTSYYVTLTDFTLSDDWLAPNTTKYFNIRKVPSNATWSGERFFTWSISNSKASMDSNNPGRITGVSSGKFMLTVTHRITGVQKSFTINCGTVRDGIYLIRNAQTNKYIDIQNQSTSSGADLIQATAHSGASQRWIFTLDSDGDYSIQSMHSWKLMQVEDAASSSGDYIEQGDSYSYDHASWYITLTSSGNYKIAPKSNTNCVLTLLGIFNITSDYIKLGAYINNSSYYDEWILDTAGAVAGIDEESAYNIEISHSGHALDVTGAGTANGTLINQYPVTPGYQWQRWTFEYCGDGVYKIRDMHSGKLFSISGSSSSNNANCHIWADDGTTGQLFKIRENIDGTYTILSKCSNYTKAVTLYGGGSSHGDIFVHATDTKAANQKVHITESNKAIIIVPGLGGSVLLMNNQKIFAYERFRSIYAVDKILDGEYQEMYEEFANAEGQINIQAVINDFTSDMTNTTEIDAMTSMIYLQLVGAGAGALANYVVGAKSFHPFDTDTFDKFGYNNTYKQLYEGLEECILPEDKSKTPIYPKYNLDLFTYDWRKSCSVSAEALELFIDQRRYESVILIGHSMGGLVASGYMARGEEQRRSVERYISFGSPHLGTPIATAIFLTGDISIFFGSGSLDENWWSQFLNATIKECILENIIPALDSVYELLPTREYFEKSGGYLTYTGYTDLSKTVCTTYESTREAISDHMAGYEEQKMLNAEAFHNSLYVNGKHISSTTNHLYVYSNNQEMIYFIDYKPYLIFDDYSFTFSKSGDSMVTSASAMMGDFSNAYRVSEAHTPMVEFISYDLLETLLKRS